MDPTDLSDAQLDQLADQLAGRLPSGTHGDRVVLSRRAFAAAVGGTLGASGLVALGVDPAAAQAAGQVGTSADPVDAFVYDFDVANALQSDLDAGGNALTNVGSLSTGKTQTEKLESIKTTETIDNGLIPYSSSYIEVDGEGGSADDLEGISDPVDGAVVTLIEGDADITVINSAGNGPTDMRLDGSDYVMDDVFSGIRLMYTTNRWKEIARF